MVIIKCLCLTHKMSKPTYRLSLLVTIIVLYIGQCFGFTSWTMLNECGGELSTSEYAGALVLDTDSSSVRECQVTITPLQLNEYVPNKIKFYFMSYTYYGSCAQTNLTIADGRTINSPPVEALTHQICYSRYLEEQEFYYTASPSLTIKYSSTNSGRTSRLTFVIKFVAYHTASCAAETEHECSSGQCVPESYRCSSEIHVCAEVDDTCDDKSIDINIIGRAIGSVVCVVIFCVFFDICRKKMRSCSRSRPSCPDCRFNCNCRCPRAADDCLRGARNVFCTVIPSKIERAIRFIREKIRKLSGQESEPEAPSVNTVSASVPQGPSVTTTSTNISSGDDSQQVTFSRRDYNDAVNIVDEDTPHRPRNVPFDINGAPPDYNELFTDDYTYEPPVLEQEPVVPSYEEAIANTQENTVDTSREEEPEPNYMHNHTISTNARTRNTDNIPNDDNNDVTDVEIDTVYNYSTDSDWDTESNVTSVPSEISRQSSVAHAQPEAPPPSYDAVHPPPYYYDYMANVSRYKP